MGSYNDTTLQITYTGRLLRHVKHQNLTISKRWDTRVSSPYIVWGGGGMGLFSLLECWLDINTHALP